MASSEVGIASSTPPFGCVLRDHTWRDSIDRSSRENCNNVKTAFETKIKYCVQDPHLHASTSALTLLRNPPNASERLVNQENEETRQRGCKMREVSPNLSDDDSIETKNPGCVSSLVQRWRGFANTRHINAKTSNPNSPSFSSASVSNADSNNALGKSNYFHECVISVSGEITSDSPSEKFDTPCSEKFDTPSTTMGDDAFLDWESDRAVRTGLPSAQSHNPEDGGEKERLRVADVIRKLRLENATVGNGTEIKKKEREKRDFSSVITPSPRIRGRQAFNDLLMQLERDRHVELGRLVEHRAVSKFSHRGRIQSLLRLRFLRRDAIDRHHHQQQQSKVIGPQQHSHSTPALAPQQSSSGEPSTSIDNRQNLSSSPIGIETRKPEAIAGKQEDPISKSEQNSHCEATATDGQDFESLPSQYNQISQGSKVGLLREKFNVLDKTDAATPKTPKSDARSFSLCIKSSSASNQLEEELRPQQEVINAARTSWSSQNSVTKETEEVSSQTSDPLQQETNFEIDNKCSLESEKISTISNEWELINKLEEHDMNNSASLRQEASYEDRNICSPISEKTMKISNVWEDSKDNQNNHDSGDHQVFESGEEWRNNDTQYWNEWDEEEISNLNWVSDIARPKSDWENLRQARYKDMLDSEDENDEMRRLLERKSVSTFLTSKMRDTMDQLMISRAERVPQSREDHHEHRLEQIVIPQIQTQTNIGKEEEEEEGRGSNFSDQVRYSSFEQPRSSQSSYPDTQPISALTNRSSIDIDYIYDLRACMEQLHQEVSELRKTVNRCMDMQEQMQCSIKQEVATAVDLSVGRAVQGSASNATRTRSCCLCYEKQVDSLLYRCGHMCACFKCARELQWSTGKCPICQAPIVDVVRAYPEGNFPDRR